MFHLLAQLYDQEEKRGEKDNNKGGGSGGGDDDDDEGEGVEVKEAEEEGEEDTNMALNLQAPCILCIGQAFSCSPENAFYIFNQQIYFII